MGIGAETLYQTTGSYNVASGYQALKNNTTGEYNSALGALALTNATTGTYNTALGSNSLQFVTTQSENSAIGYNTGGNFSSTRATFAGVNARNSASGYTNTTAIGYNAVCTASNQVRIGNNSVTSIGGFAAWTNISDGRFKTNVTENVKGLDFILQLKPVTYNLNTGKISEVLYGIDAQQGDSISYLQTGFIAQDVESAAQMAGYNFSGIDKPKNETDFYGLRYAEFVVPLVKALQEQQVMIEQLQKELEELTRD